MGEKIDAQWYAENYTPWIDDINSYEDLEKFWANLNPRYKRRFDHWFRNIELKGTVLELGFNNGKTLKWLNDRYKKIVLFGIDFNPTLEKIIPYIQDNNSRIFMSIGDLTEEYYEPPFNNIICLDFVEHLYHGIYLMAIENMYMLLEDGGQVYVFAGYAKLKEHVNILSLEEIRNDFTNKGFKFITKITEPGTGDTMQIFEK